MKFSMLIKKSMIIDSASVLSLNFVKKNDGEILKLLFLGTKFAKTLLFITEDCLDMLHRNAALQGL